MIIYFNRMLFLVTDVAYIILTNLTFFIKNTDLQIKYIKNFTCKWHYTLGISNFSNFTNDN